MMKRAGVLVLLGWAAACLAFADEPVGWRNDGAAAYDLEGKRLWARHVESSNVGFGHSASPLLIGGKLIVHVRDLVALDVATGKESWRTGLQASHASPVAAKLGKEDVIVS